MATRQASGPPPKVEPCMPGPMDSRGAFVRDDHAQRNAAGQRLRRHHDVGQHHGIGKLISEIFAHPAHAALDLIENQQRIVTIRQFARLAGVFGGHRDRCRPRPGSIR